MAPPAILHVEDSASDLDLTEMAWTEGGHPGELVGFRDCPTTIEHLRACRRDACLPDLIILDLNLPGCHGSELLEFMHAEGMAIPVVVLTSSANPKDRQYCTDLGAVDFLVKPSSYRELRQLVDRIAKHLDHPAS